MSIYKIKPMIIQRTLNKINYAIDQVNDAEGAWKNKLYNRYYEQNDIRKLNFIVKEKAIIYPCGFYDVSNTWSRFFCNGM